MARRVRPHEFLVDIGAPAGAGRQQHFAVFDDRRVGDDVVLPAHIVDVDFHDFEVRRHRAHMGAYQRAQMAVEIMRRHIDLVGVGHCRDLQQFENAVPGHVDDRVIDRLVLEIGAELAPAIQRLAGRDRGAGRAPDQCQPGRVVEVDLEPHQVERLQRPRQFDIAVDLVIKVGVEMQPDIAAGAAAEGFQLRDRGLDDAMVDIELGKPRLVAGAGAVHVGLALVEADQVGLEPLGSPCAGPPRRARRCRRACAPARPRPIP